MVKSVVGSHHLARGSDSASICSVRRTAAAVINVIKITRARRGQVSRRSNNAISTGRPLKSIVRAKLALRVTSNIELTRTSVAIVAPDNESPSRRRISKKCSVSRMLKMAKKGVIACGRSRCSYSIG